MPDAVGEIDTDAPAEPSAPQESQRPTRVTPTPPTHWVDHQAGDPKPVTKRWLRALRAVAAAIFSTEAGPPPGPRLDWLCQEADDHATHVGKRSRRVLRLSLWCITWLAPLYLLRPAPLRWLRPATQVRALERYERGLLGLTLLAVKAWLCIIYYEHPDAAREIGFDGRCMGETPGLVAEETT